MLHLRRKGLFSHGSRRIYFRLITTAHVRPISSVLVANRGEIAIRVGRTASELGIRCTMAYTDPDVRSRHALLSPFNANLGPSSAYLDGEKIIATAKLNKCEALHPGYGFLSENFKFARKCHEEGLIFIGPSWEAIEALGDKSRSKDIMIKAGIPCIPGYHGPNQAPDFLLEEARKIGFPIIVKATKGGGGKGMRVVASEADFFDELKSAKSEGVNAFGNDEMLIEKYITTPRHIEVQIFGDKYGNVIALGERDCSVQRRHQKIIEEAPAPKLTDSVRKDLWKTARAAAAAVNYEGAGTVEFLFDKETENFYFMEVNTRLQVEHPVTEAMIGQDLVAWQFKVAAGEPLPLDQKTVEEIFRARGWAIEARIYAENTELEFVPDSGKLKHMRMPKISDYIRIDAGFNEGDTVSSIYDGMIAKLIVNASTRSLAVQRLHTALQEFEVVGLRTNIDFLKNICRNSAYIEGEFETGFIQKYKDQLLAPTTVAPEVFAQAAIGLLRSKLSKSFYKFSRPYRLNLGYAYLNEYKFSFYTSTGREDKLAHVILRITNYSCYNVEVNINNTKRVFDNVICENKGSLITSFFSHTRIDSRVISHDDVVTIFQHGQRTELRLTNPCWIKTALEVKDDSRSVVASMPCKILRIIVRKGDIVEINEPLIIIESMKMETIIRSPKKGVIFKVTHKEGDICKKGDTMVTFQ